MGAKDVEKAQAEPVATPAADATEAAVPAPDIVEDIRAQLALIDSSVTTNEARFVLRVFRALPQTRHRLTLSALNKVAENSVGDAALKAVYTKHLASVTNAMDVEETPSAASAPAPSKTVPSLESDVFVGILVLVFLIDAKNSGAAWEVAQTVLEKQSALTRHVMDHLYSRVFYFYARAAEGAGKQSTLRPGFLKALRTATLRHLDETQATILNELLRNFLHFNLYDQADKLVANAEFPSGVSNAAHSRYLFYVGRIKAIQLEYTAAFRSLQDAIRKAPQNAIAAGFQQAAHKLLIVVQLLLGEIPERTLFRQRMFRKALLPYLHLTQAVQIGDLRMFQEVMSRHSAKFQSDKTFTLILRLRHNVIKAGLRMISISYSRISLRDIAQKLHLDSVEDAEFVAAKAISDGVIDATIDHEQSFLKSHETQDLYATNEPQDAFNQRIQFCMELHNMSVKALRYPPNAKNDLESAEARRERESQDRELAKEIAEGDEEEEDAMF